MARPLPDSTSLEGAPKTADRILDVAEVLFAERGFAGTAMRDIATRCELKVGSLYNHFESKQALYEAVLERGLQPLFEVLHHAAAVGDPATVGEDVIGDVMAHLAERPHIPRLIQHEAASGGQHLARLARIWIHPLMSEALGTMKRANARGEEDAPLIIVAWMNLIFGYFSMAPLLAELLDVDPLSPETLAQQTDFLRRLARRFGDVSSDGSSDGSLDRSSDRSSETGE